MSDIATAWNAEGSFGDWTVLAPSAVAWTDEHGDSIRDENGRPVDALFTAGGILATNDDLFTAALISIFTDAEAGPDDKSPLGDDDPRGWWAGPIGSKLWLRSRSRLDAITQALVKHDIENALDWMIQDGVVVAIDVELEVVERGQLQVRIGFRRTDGAKRALAFAALWEDL
jgi:phage gp46-like protein